MTEGAAVRRTIGARLSAVLVIAGCAGGSAPDPAVGFPSVAAARAALENRPGAVSSRAEGWLIVEERASRTLWSFTPAGHPAHPAVVKRVVVERDGAVFIEMNALCEADKAACDGLWAEFQALNDRIRESFRRGRQ